MKDNRGRNTIIYSVYVWQDGPASPATHGLLAVACRSARDRILPKREFLLRTAELCPESSLSYSNCCEVISYPTLEKMGVART